MNIKFKFIDEKTVKIEASTGWHQARPHASRRKIVRIHEILDTFKKQHPAYNIESILGPDSISNFREKEDSEGVWTLTVSKVKKTPKTKVEKRAPEPKERTPSAPRYKGASRKTTKKGA